jgi:hypothetical protein
MGKLGTGLLAVVAGAAGAVVYLAYRVSKETGKSLSEALSDVPAEAQRYLEDVRARGTDALEAGREAARQKQSEIERQLRDQSQNPAA